MSVIRLLTELDALLDTRAGLMDILDPEAAVRLVSNPAYYTRTDDKFEALCGYPDDLYAKAWKSRTVETLKHSINTPVRDLLHYALLDIERRSIDDPSIDSGALDINIWPYKLTDAEVREMGLAIASVIGCISPIRLVEHPWSFYTPQYVKDTYSGLILYNHNQWLEAMGESLFLVGLPAITLAAPKLTHSRMPTAEEMDFGTKKVIDPWEAASYMMSQNLGIDYVDVLHYCLAHPTIATTVAV